MDESKQPLYRKNPANFQAILTYENSVYPHYTDLRRVIEDIDSSDIPFPVAIHRERHGESLLLNELRMREDRLSDLVGGRRNVDADPVRNIEARFLSKILHAVNEFTRHAFAKKIGR